MSVWKGLNATIAVHLPSVHFEITIVYTLECKQKSVCFVFSAIENRDHK